MHECTFKVIKNILGTCYIFMKKQVVTLNWELAYFKRYFFLVSAVLLLCLLFSPLFSFFYWATPCRAQRLLFTLCSEITFGRLRHLYGMSGIKPTLAVCKANIRPSVISLVAPCVLSFNSFLTIYSLLFLIWRIFWKKRYRY